MEMILKIAAVTAIAGVGGTGLGGLAGAFIKRDSQRIVSFLLSAAGGVMLGIVCFDLLTGALGTGDTCTHANTLVVIMSVIIGFGLVFLLNNIIDRRTDKEVSHFDSDHPKTADDLGELVHTKHLDEHRKNNSGLFVAGIVMACAIALHNLPEGIVIGASYANNPTNLLSGSGFIMAIVLGLHNIPEGMAVSVPLISGGDKKLHAVLITALTGSPTIIGAVIGYVVGNISPLALSISLGFASGAMLYVVFGEMLPEAFLIWRSKLPAFGVLLGLAISLLIVFM